MVMIILSANISIPFLLRNRSFPSFALFCVSLSCSYHSDIILCTARAMSSSSSSSSSSHEEDEGDLVLEGVLMRNPDASDSSSDDDSESDDSDDDLEDEDVDSKPPAKKQKHSKKEVIDNDKKGEKPNKHTKKKKNNRGGPEIVPMEFTFCDMNEKFFHGMKALLVSSSPIYLPISSTLTDLMISNVVIGTVISTTYEYKKGVQRDPDYENVVYGFASILNVSSTTNKNQECIQNIKKICLSKCPSSHKSELEIVLSGKTKRPAGILLQCRMINLPLEIVDVLHQQLILDMDHAVDNVISQGGTEEQRKSLDYGAFIRIAPTYRESGTTNHYKYFDDELFATHAEFTYEIELPKTYGMEETPYCTVIVMTKTGHRAAIKNLKKMVSGGGI